VLDWEFFLFFNTDNNKKMSEESCDTEYWSNDAENSALNKK